LGQLAEHSTAAELLVDFSDLQRVSPAGLAALTAFMARRERNRLTTNVAGLERCGIRDYLSRMNLLRRCGWEHGEESFERRDSSGRFVPLEEIPHRVEDLGAQIAACIAPGGEDYGNSNAGLYDAAFYLITEMANNVRQHSRGVGFVAAQTTQRDGFVKIAIADCGCGIPASLKGAGFPWAQDLPDEDIIEQAMAARVSSKGQPANEGVGLTLSSRIVDLMGGHMLIASGAGTVIRSNNVVLKKGCLPEGIGYPGTLVAMTFLRSQAADFEYKLHKAKELEIPLRASPNSATFQP
jgi:transcription initiation factor TFIIIB Brf1 subunit/transcription initiation factor TFIIB